MEQLILAYKWLLCLVGFLTVLVYFPSSGIDSGRNHCENIVRASVATNKSSVIFVWLFFLN